MDPESRDPDKPISMQLLRHDNEKSRDDRNDSNDSNNSNNARPPIPPKSPKAGRYLRVSYPMGNHNHHYDVENTEHEDTLLPARESSNTDGTYADPIAAVSPSPQADDDENFPDYHDTNLDHSMHQRKSRNACAKLFLSPRQEYRAVKACFAVLLSVILGAVMYPVLLYGYKYSNYVAGVISCAATVIMSACFAFSVKARCTAALIVPSLCTAQGRTAILSLIAGLILMGPMINITENLENVAYSIDCGVRLTKNLTAEIENLYAQPMYVVLETLEPQIEKLQDEEKRLHDDLLNLKRFINRVEKEPSQAQVCSEQMDMVYDICEKEINAAQTACKNRISDVTQAQYMCTFRSVKQSCKSRLKNICEQTPFISARDSQVWDNVRNVQILMKRIQTDINITFDDRNIASNVTINETDINTYIHEKATKAIYILTLMQIIGKALSMSVILLIVHSFMYLRRFLTKDTFDNCYITKGLKRLDLKNRTNHKHAVLPLRKAERRTLIDSTKPWLSPQEKAQFKHGLATLMLHMVAGSIVCIFDYFLYWVLDVTHYGINDFTNQTHSSHPVHITGTGLLAQIIRIFNQAIIDSPSRHIPETCNQSPHQPSFTKYYVIAAAYIVAFILVFAQAYFMRLRRKVVAYYYPERETERNNYLITKILRKRTNFTNRLTRNIQRTIRERKLETKEQINLIVWLRQAVVAVFCWKVRRPAHCLVCDDVDKGKFYHCQTAKCHGIYCRECFRDVRNVCQLCFIHETV